MAWGKPYGNSWSDGTGRLITMRRLRQRVRFFDALTGAQIGPEQSNVAPAVAFAQTMGWTQNNEKAVMPKRQNIQFDPATKEFFKTKQVRKPGGRFGQSRRTRLNTSEYQVLQNGNVTAIYSKKEKADREVSRIKKAIDREARREKTRVKIRRTPA